ncbi:hypothetical protein BOX15_Mlig012838g10 [Macrostomum lignano]|uniref:receptor protein-tyrosine kinase n=1 Tax=Macrostomum lignano TaxID=282301 RepID=A0A267G008_9PLAT|nr:hypothetical protein BOX15_Mlig012838g10 [Macrostomum lignano]
MTLRLRLLTLQLLLLAASASASQPLGSSSRLCKTVYISSREYRTHRNISRLHAELQASVDGCQYVHGDVIIQNIGADSVTEEPIDEAIRGLQTDFLDSIIEISGRLVIKRINLERISLRNLRAIRGYNLENTSPFFAMEVFQSKYPVKLELPQLSAILQGDVRIIGNLHADLYCYLSRRINWPSLFQSHSSRTPQQFNDNVEIMTLGDQQINVSDYAATEKVCTSLPACNSSCHTEKSGRQLCWSDSPGGCQSFHGCLVRPCRNCFRHPYTGNEECCESDCLGGCSNKSDGCFSCRDVSLDGVCKGNCPMKTDLNPGTNKIETRNSSTTMKRVGNICVKQCEMPFVTSSNDKYCVSECPLTEIPVNGICTRCAAKHQSACETCTVDTLIMSDKVAQALKNGNCTIWRTDSSLDINSEKLNSSASLETLEFLRIFYGRLFIKRTDRLVDNLRFLRNLKFVSNNFGIMMLHTRYLGLASLRYAKALWLIKISGLCEAWYPSRRIRQITEVTKEFTIGTREISFDNTSEVCRNAVCDPQCRDECWGPGSDMCVACRNFEVDGRCYATCQDSGRYNLSGECQECHSECEGGCSSPSASECERCSNLEEDGKCVAACSSREMRADSKGRCYSVASARLLTVGIGVGLLILVLLVLLPVAYVHYRRRMRKYEIVDLDEYLTDPSNPNAMAKLLIVNDDDVMKQKEIGSGAFGTVYKGILRSSTNKGVRELPVAIKVLRGHSPKLGQELLNEASMLARVQHPCCIRLVALCLTQEPQLITALMPRGCLLEFLRAHRNQIGAERMLRWGLQVAEGMEYLESLGIVHRDLAARNVLLQTPDQVRITDFGLARLLDMSEGEFIQTAGLLPVKWLGVECFESGLFSHKSDVWSYGVLLWEICTFGESPYNPYGIRSVEDITGLLKKGIRLNQPDICSIDFYNILLSCWLPHPESRPSFRDMVGTMNDCLACPSKYIAQRYSTMDPNLFDTDDAVGFVTEVSKPAAPQPLQKSPDKHGVELNSYISDPTSCSASKLRNSPARALQAQASNTSESAGLLSGQMSVPDANDDYLTPTSPGDNYGDVHDGGGACGLDDYLTPRKA